MNSAEEEYQGYRITWIVKSLDGGGYICEGSMSPRSSEAVTRLQPVLKVGEERVFPDAISAKSYYLKNADGWIDKIIAQKG